MLKEEQIRTGGLNETSVSADSLACAEWDYSLDDRRIMADTGEGLTGDMCHLRVPSCVPLLFWGLCCDRGQGNARGG